jgi:hypothetical protein
MLSVAILSVVMLSAITPKTILLMLYDECLNVEQLMMNVIMPCVRVVMVSVNMLWFIMPNDIMPCVIVLSSVSSEAAFSKLASFCLRKIFN